MLRFARFLLVTALMISIGAQWAVLQSAAWVGMAVSYSIKQGSISAGLSQTFDGKHPCPLCKAVKQGSESDKKDSAKQDLLKKKLELFTQHQIITFVSQDTPEQLWMREPTATPRRLVPPVPPPRCGSTIV